MKPTRVVAKVLLFAPSGKILLLQRSKTDTRRPLQWDLPGGAVDGEEDYKEAACRETLEESGFVIQPDSISLAYTMAQNTVKGNVCWLFFTGSLPAEQIPVLSSEHSAYQWVELKDALGKILYERQQKALRHIMQYVLA